jgi:hypothetical protein
MAVSWCPHCNLPLTREESRASACPGCAKSLSSRPRQLAAITPPRKTPVFVRVALVTAAIAGTATFFALRSLISHDSGRVVAREVSDAHPVVVQAAQKPWDGPQTQPAEASPAIAAIPTRSPHRAIIPNPVPTPATPLPGDVLVLENPDGEHIIKSMSGGQVIKLAGRVNTLKIGPITGKSTLDASGLRARYILVGGVIDGGSNVKLCAPEGKVEFCSPINGRSTVQVNAPGGEVWFGPQGYPRNVTRINGESNVIVHAREVQIRGIVNGTHTRIDVTLTPGGRLHFVELTGGSRLVYRKEAPADPDPQLQKGIVSANAKVEQIN